jgi:hypothetical protein
MTDDVLGVVDMILECVKGAYDFDHDPWDQVLGACHHHHRCNWCPPCCSILFLF